MSKRKKFIANAFLFNSPDWFIDTAEFSSQEKGYYIDLLAMQWANKSISSDPHRLFTAVGGNDPFSDHDIFIFLETSPSTFTRISLHEYNNSESIRNGLRDGLRQEPSRSSYKKSFLECWQHIKKKFITLPNGDLINERLETERAAVSEYNDIQRERTARATEARWGKRKEDNKITSVTESVTESSTNPLRTEKISVTETNCNYNCNTFNKNKKGNSKNPDPPEKTENLKTVDKIISTGAEKSVSRGVSREMRLFLPNLEESYSAVVDQALKSYADKFLMHHHMYGKPEEFQVFLLEQYFYDQGQLPGNIAPSLLLKNFTFWLNNNFGRLERAFNNRAKTEQWFNSELEKTNGLCGDADMRDRFKKYYLSPQPSGKLHFQTLSNFSVRDSLERWVKSDFKKIKKAEQASGVTVIPSSNTSMDELLKHYKK